MNRLACDKSSHVAALCQLSGIMCSELSGRMFAEVIMSAASVCSADTISLCMIYQPLVSPAKITARGWRNGYQRLSEWQNIHRRISLTFVVSSLKFSQPSQRFREADGWDSTIPQQGQVDGSKTLNVGGGFGKRDRRKRQDSGTDRSFTSQLSLLTDCT